MVRSSKNFWKSVGFEILFFFFCIDLDYQKYVARAQQLVDKKRTKMEFISGGPTGLLLRLNQPSHVGHYAINLVLPRGSWLSPEISLLMSLAVYANVFVAARAVELPQMCAQKDDNECN